MRVEHKIIIDTHYSSFSERMAVLIEETLHRNRKIVAITTSATIDHFYGSIFWTE